MAIESAPVAVYVHLGPNFPKHLLLSLIRHRTLFPKQELALITSDDQTFEIPSGIELFKVNTSELEASLFLEMSQNLDFEFRNGFWKYTLQRFFAINEFHKVIPSKAITHVESDVLLMPNFPWEKFAALKKLAWLKVNSEVDVAAIVHFPSPAHTEMLSKEIVTLAKATPGTNDMIVLHKLAEILKSNHEYLPSLTPNNKSPFIDKKLQEKRVGYFGGIFDPLALGLWYFGQDPKNSFGLRKRYVGDISHDLNPVNTKLSICNGVLHDQSGTQVFSLHVHSKLLSLFGENWESSLKSQLIEAGEQRKKYSFNIQAMFQAMRSRKVRETTWILIALIPGLQHLRKLRAFEVSKNFVKKLFRI